MALSVKSSFSGGELDPALHERTNLQKYSSALATARNVIIGKTGRILSRPGRKLLFACLYHDVPVRTHTFVDRGTAYLIEFSVSYLRTYTSTDGDNFTLLETAYHTYTEAELPYIQFVNWLYPTSSGTYLPTVLLFCKGRTNGYYIINSGTFTVVNGIYDTNINSAPSFVSNTQTGASTGYAVRYAITVVRQGEETNPYYDTTASVIPVAAGQYNTIIVSCGTAAATNKVTEIRVYRRPEDPVAGGSGGAYGFIGSSSVKYTSGGNYRFSFLDYGQAADYSHQPPTMNPTCLDTGLTSTTTPSNFESQAGTLYQQRLLVSSDAGIEASRVGYPLNFTRDYPYSATSSISFTNVTRGAKTLWMIENQGLVVFTTEGIYLHSGTLTPTNLALDKKGEWVIDEIVGPIAIPGAVLFVDRATSTVRQLSYSLENGSYTCEELSIFSNHLFEEKRIVSWAFQDGSFPLLWVAFNDGTAATFTYERDHEMRAWTRHDSDFNVEHVVKLDRITPDQESSIIYVVEEDGYRYVCKSIPRYVTPEQLEDNPEADKGETIAACDEIVSYNGLLENEESLTELNSGLGGGDVFSLSVITTWDEPLTLTCGTSGVFTDPGPGSVGAVLRVSTVPFDLTVTARASDNSITVDPGQLYPNYGPHITAFTLSQVTTNSIEITPVVADTWDGELTIDCEAAGLFTSPGPGAVGNILRWFNPTDKTSIDLTVTARASNNSITVEPSETFPSEYALEPRLYNTTNVITGLDHLEGKNVSIISDGFILASPNNDIVEYPTVTVSGGSVTLPNSTNGAIVHVGLPYTMDIETLDIDTVEQRPVLIESKTVNKVYVKTHQSRGLYAGNRFPADDTVEGNDETGTFMSLMDGLDSYEVNNELQDPITGNRYDQPTSRRYEVLLPGDWNSNGRVCIRQVDPIHFEILSIIPDLEDLRR